MVAIGVAGLVGLFPPESRAQQSAANGVIYVRHAPTLGGLVQGSIQQLLPEDITLVGNAGISGDLLVPGTPNVTTHGSAAVEAVIEGNGALIPSNYSVTLTGNVHLMRIVRRTNPVTLTAVNPPARPVGTRSVSLGGSNQAPGDFSTLRDLALDGGANSVSIPPGIYGDFVANGNAVFRVGIAGATSRARYDFQHLTLNGSSRIEVVGPVIITVGAGMSPAGSLGASGHPAWLQLNLAAGDFSLSGSAVFYGFVNAPGGSVAINGGAHLVGGVSADRFATSGSAWVQSVPKDEPNRLPTVRLFSPTEGTAHTFPATLTLAASAEDSD
ncbi:MAG: autotransporter-associated beta strand repeat protein, partial [Lacunisphaera sp.]|nr:autotransporter-associated beta strand repeat protein [Lacunisphaera sp.]